jgi:hypothetical protein
LVVGVAVPPVADLAAAAVVAFSQHGNLAAIADTCGLEAFGFLVEGFYLIRCDFFPHIPPNLNRSSLIVSETRKVILFSSSGTFLDCVPSQRFETICKSSTEEPAGGGNI